MRRLNKIVKKPWGKFYDFAQSKGKWHLKALIIKKGQRLSLQRHEKRSEFWIIVEGKVRVQKGGKTYTMGPQDTIISKKRELHRILALADAIVIEVSFGNHKESDIKRIKDDYGRSHKN